MIDPELVRLIGGPYRPPHVKVGDVATCLYRDCDVVITAWHDARIAWPRCRRRDQAGGGGSGLLVDEALLRAIRTESAEALKYWFGVGTSQVWAWRNAFGIRQRATAGSKRLYERTAEKLGDLLRGKAVPAPTRRKMQHASLARDAAESLRNYAAKNRRSWKAQKAALIGTMKDTQLARQLGRTRSEVYTERLRRGIPAYCKPKPSESLLSLEERERLRRQRIAAAKRGKKRPRHVIEAIRKGRTGKQQSDEAGAKMRAAHARRKAGAS